MSDPAEAREIRKKIVTVEQRALDVEDHGRKRLVRSDGKREDRFGKVVRMDLAGDAGGNRPAAGVILQQSRPLVLEARNRKAADARRA